MGKIFKYSRAIKKNSTIKHNNLQSQQASVKLQKVFKKLYFRRRREICINKIHSGS